MTAALSSYSSSEEVIDRCKAKQGKILWDNMRSLLVPVSFHSDMIGCQIDELANKLSVSLEASGVTVNSDIVNAIVTEFGNKSGNKSVKGCIWTVSRGNEGLSFCANRTSVDLHGDDSKVRMLSCSTKCKSGVFTSEHQPLSDDELLALQEYCKLSFNRDEDGNQEKKPIASRPTMHGVEARYISGDSELLTDCSTVRDIRVKIASLNDKYAPDVVVLSLDSCEEYEDDDNEAPEKVQVVIQERVRDMVFWESALLAHARSRDVCGVERIKAEGQIASPSEFCGKVLVHHLDDEVVDGNCVRTLVECGADLHTGDLSAVEVAISKGHEEVIDIFLAGGKVDVNDALTQAAKRNKRSLVEKFMAAGGEINRENDGTNPPLVSAAKNKNTQLCRILLEANASVNITGSKNTTALSVAAENGDVDTCRVLMDAGASLNSTCDAGKTALMRAAKEGHSDVIRVFTARASWEPAFAHSQDCAGQTALAHALYHNHEKAALELLRVGSPVNQRMSTKESSETSFYNTKKCAGLKVARMYGPEMCRELYSITPLQVAASYKNLALVSALLDAKAEIDAKDDNGNNALLTAAFYGNTDVIGLLIKAGASVNSENNMQQKALILAAGQGLEAEATFLIDSGADINAENIDKKSPLIVATTASSLATVKMLIAKGASVNHCDKRKRTAFHYVALKDDLDVLKELLLAGSQVQAEDEDGRTPLILSVFPTAIRSMIEGMIIVSKAVNADLNHQDRYKRTALHYASSRGNRFAVDRLIAAGVDVSVEDRDNRAALAYAAARGHLVLLRSLLGAGASVNHQDCENKLALHYAASQGHIQTVRELIASGSDVGAEDGDKRTAVAYALAGGHDEVVQALVAAGAVVPEVANRLPAGTQAAIEEVAVDADIEPEDPARSGIENAMLRMLMSMMGNNAADPVETVVNACQEVVTTVLGNETEDVGEEECETETEETDKAINSQQEGNLDSIMQAGNRILAYNPRSIGVFLLAGILIIPFSIFVLK